MSNWQLIPVHKEILQQMKSYRGIWRFGERFNLQTEVFLPMSPTKYHCFIISGDHEFHPRFSFNKGKIVKSHSNVIRAGLFLRIKNLSPENIRKFQEFLPTLKGIRTPSCHLGVLQALRTGLNIKIKGAQNDKMTPSQFIKAILELGFEDQDGKDIPFEMYVLKDKSVDEILDEIKYFEKKFK